MIRPEAFYERTFFESLDELEYSTPVVGIAMRVNQFFEVEVDLGNGMIGIIPANEFTVYNFSYYDDSDIPKEMSRIIGNKIRAITLGVSESGYVLLSRKRSMLEAWKEIQEDSVLSASVIGFYYNGIFVDVGNGISTFLPNLACSAVKFSNPTKWFNINQQIFVKLIKKEPLYKVFASAKEAYPSLSENDQIVKNGDLIVVKIGSNENLYNAYFCEYTPSISGIIDSNMILEEGELVVARVKKITPKGLKLNLK